MPPFAAGETVIVLGLCGALRRLETGDVAIYARVTDGTRTLELDRTLVDALASALPGAFVVNACTGERVVTTASARAPLARRFDADVVDMEGTHLADALGARRVRFAMIRVVSDDAARDLPRSGTQSTSGAACGRAKPRLRSRGHRALRSRSCATCGARSRR